MKKLYVIQHTSGSVAWEWHVANFLLHHPTENFIFTIKLKVWQTRSCTQIALIVKTGGLCFGQLLSHFLRRRLFSVILINWLRLELRT